MKGLKYLTAMALLAVASPAIGNCTDQHPQIGTLELDGPGSAAVMREGRSLRVGNAAMICISDEILGNGTAGRVRTSTGRTFAFGPAGHLAMPDREGSILSWLLDMFTSRQIFVQAGSMASNGPAFALRSMAGNEQIVETGRSTLLIPMVSSDRPYVLGIYRSSRSQRMTFVDVQPGTTWVRIQVPRQRGHYTIAIEGTSMRAMVEVGSVRTSPAINQYGLRGSQAAFAYACMNPETNFLESVQRLDALGDAQPYLNALLVWQNATDQLSCATPL